MSRRRLLTIVVTGTVTAGLILSPDGTNLGNILSGTTVTIGQATQDLLLDWTTPKCYYKVSGVTATGYIDVCGYSYVR